MRILNKIICLLLAQIFFINNICFAIDNFAERNNLSPAININSGDMAGLFAEFLALEQGLNNAEQYLGDLGQADNLDQGYDKLSLLVKKNAQIKQGALIICFDGSGSAGKSTLFKRIRKNGIADFRADQIEFLSIDRIAIDLLSMGDYSMHDALLEMPFILVDRISKAKIEKKLIIIDGIESFGIISMIYDNKSVPDIAVIMKASERIRLKRDLMRFGIVAGLRLFDSRRHDPNPPQGSIPLIIHNNQESVSSINFVFRTALRTLTAAVEYVLPEFIVEFFIDKQAYITDKVGILKNRFTSLDMIRIVMFPLDCGVFALNKLFDFYHAFYPDHDIARIIKKRFKNEIVRILDVGTGNGEFIKRFEKILDKKNIAANIQGIEIKASEVVKARKNGVLVRGMDIKDLEAKFGKSQFDIITVNAPDSPEYSVEQAMLVLKPKGMLILRTAKLFFSEQEKAKLIKSLSNKYDVQVGSKNIYNLPTGLFYKLHKPLIITHKKISGVVNQKDLEQEELISINSSVLGEKSQLFEADFMLKKFIEPVNVSVFGLMGQSV